MAEQLELEIGISDDVAAAAQAYVDAYLVALGEGMQPQSLATLPDDVYAELKRTGDLDLLMSMEIDDAEAAGERIDWADPDSFESETTQWYDRYADPHSWSDDADTDEHACTFYLGTHRPNWLYKAGSRERRPEGPLFVSARQLAHARRSAYPPCDTRYAIDSGGFTELRQHGGWVTTAAAYVAQVRALAEQTGTLDWAAIQDWMVENDALACTGLSVQEHQQRTTASYLELVAAAPEIRWLPVLQGQTLGDYLRHIEIYAQAGVHLPSHERVGVGSVCRRQGSDEIAAILRELASRGLRLHGFGVKTAGLEKAAPYLVSSDSLAWSLGARKRGAPGDANSQHVAETYRDQMLAIPGIVGRTAPESGWTSTEVAP